MSRTPPALQAARAVGWSAGDRTMVATVEFFRNDSGAVPLRAISEFAAARLGQPSDSLYPLAVGRSTLAVCRAAYDRWVARADSDLTVYLDAAITALAAGFGAAAPSTESQSGRPR